MKPSVDEIRRAMLIFDRVCDVPRDERSALLNAECNGDDALRARVKDMLAAEDDEHAVLADSNQGAGALMLADEIAEATFATEVPERIGRYRVIREIGRGGMGVVYEAEQENPSRTIALKILPPGFANAAVLRRFQREADMLGRMRHPGITQIFEAGLAELQTATGMTARQPFIAMELVPGQPLDTYVQSHDLSIDEKLQLFAGVCDAIQHAHDSGVIHRDLKPNNILIESDGQPKVLDFGVSRAARAEMMAASLHTHTGQIVGTIPYMSPEQVQGDPEAVDERTDVYALGVVLYEILAGRLPHDLKNRPIIDAMRVIQEEEPSRLGSVDRAFRGDIDTILAKALEKEKHRRYQSPAALAADIRRYLAHEPLKARPVSSMYQLRKFARRNKAIVGGVVATMAACLIGAIAATVFAIRANENAREARMRETEATALSYRTSITAAAAALRENDVSTAENRLLDAPKALRKWEWEYLSNRLDQSIQAVSVEPIRKDAGYLAFVRGYFHIWFGPENRKIHLARRTAGPWSAQPLDIRTWDAQKMQLLGHRTVDNVHYYAPTVQGDALYLVSGDGSTLLQAIESGDIVTTLTPAPSPAPKYSAEILQRVPAHLIEDIALSFGEPLNDGEYARKMIASPDGRFLAKWKGRKVTVFALTGTGSSKLFKITSTKLMNAVFDPKGRRLITVNSNRQLTSYRLDAAGQIEWTVDNAHNDTIMAIAVSPNGSKIATGGQDRVINIRNVEDGHLTTTLAGHRNPILTISFDRDGTRVVSASADHVRVWDVSSTDDPTVLRGHDRHVNALSLSPDGSMLASHGRDTLLWDVKTGLMIARIPVGWNFWQSRLSWSVDGRRILVNATVMDLYSGERFKLPTDGPSRDHRFHPFEKLILSDTKKIDVQEFSTRSQHPDLGQWYFSDSGKYLSACYLKAGLLSVRKFDSLQVIREWNLPVSWMNILFDNDQKLAVATKNRDIAIFDVASGEEIARLVGHTDLVVSLVYNPKNNSLISGSRDRTVRVWNMETMEEVIELRGHQDSVNALAVTNDGRTIFSTSSDKTIRRWSTQSNRALLAARTEYREIRDRLVPMIDAMIENGEGVSAIYEQKSGSSFFSNREREVARQIVIQRANKPRD